jgi:hypothetical protein
MFTLDTKPLRKEGGDIKRGANAPLENSLYNVPSPRGVRSERGRSPLS